MNADRYMVQRTSVYAQACIGRASRFEKNQTMVSHGSQKMGYWHSISLPLKRNLVYGPDEVEGTLAYHSTPAGLEDRVEQRVY